VFLVIRSIRGKSLAEVRTILHSQLLNEMNEIDFSKPVLLSQYTSKAVHRQLARFTDWLEQQSGVPGKYEDYIVRSGKNAYEVEHIWANHYDRFADEFDQQGDFDRARNHIGGLLLLPKKINASLSDITYEEKLPHYLKANALTQSLHEAFYINNPGFQQTLKTHGLKFKPYEEFGPKEMSKRSKLYCKLADLIWSPDRLLGEGVE
jgi:tRNA splicing endonuclease